MKRLLALVCCFAVLCASAAGRPDYAALSARITARCTSERDKAEAIYRWLCRNIAYDTTYTIRDAATCLEEGRGVCEAYARLFRELGREAGLDVRVVSGVAKGGAGGGFASHAWVCVMTGENRGMLIDPTWGAGGIADGRFERSEDYGEWFDTDPRWMIFTHYPSVVQFEMLPEEEVVYRSEFDRLPNLKPFLSWYGFDPSGILRLVREGRIGPLPTFYRLDPGAVRIYAMPLEEELRVGRTYEFLIEVRPGRDAAIVENGRFRTDWECDGAFRRMRIVPSDGGELHLAIRRPDTTFYSTLAAYRIAEPTAEELAAVEAFDPYLSRDVVRMGGDGDLMKHHGVDGRKLLAAIRSGEVSSLPEFFEMEGFDYRVVDIPLDGTLRRGQRYTFVIECDPSLQTAVICGEEWYRNWKQEGRRRSIVVIPHQGTQLSVSLQLVPGGNYYSLFRYRVQ